MSGQVRLTGRERFFDKDNLVVSKTDLKGRITYANSTFINLSGYTEEELLGAPHSLIRHPDMPRCVFKLLWDVIQAKKEIFAYVINMAKNGDHYWVFAHVTPSFDQNGRITSYHSNRRVPDRDVITQHIIPLYQMLIEKENSYTNKKEGMQKAFEMLAGILEEKGVSYDEFILSL